MPHEKTPLLHAGDAWRRQNQAHKEVSAATQVSYDSQCPWRDETLTIWQDVLRCDCILVDSVWSKPPNEKDGHQDLHLREGDVAWRIEEKQKSHTVTSWTVNHDWNSWHCCFLSSVQLGIFCKLQHSNEPKPWPQLDFPHFFSVRNWNLAICGAYAVSVHVWRLEVRCSSAPTLEIKVLPWNHCIVAPLHVLLKTSTYQTIPRPSRVWELGHAKSFSSSVRRAKLALQSKRVKGIRDLPDALRPLLSDSVQFNGVSFRSSSVCKNA